MEVAIQTSLSFNQASFNLEPFLKNDKPIAESIYTTDLGALFEGDSLEILPCIQDESVDTVFADPPFNFNKK